MGMDVSVSSKCLLGKSSPRNGHNKKKYIKIIMEQEKNILYSLDSFTTEGYFSVILSLSVLRHFFPFQPPKAQGICHTGL